MSFMRAKKELTRIMDRSCINDTDIHSYLITLGLTLFKIKAIKAILMTYSEDNGINMQRKSPSNVDLEALSSM